MVIAKSGKPYIDLVPHTHTTARMPGGYHIDMSSFDSSNEKIETMFYGGDGDS